ncbi:hypothetical protein DIPPA_01373 [Diplonema papillatum]|nr:hypothetical protein DIPPA_01373 [Diplonema papillatum]
MSPEFNVATTLQRTLCTTMTFPVRTGKAEFAQYLDHMPPDGFRIVVSKDHGQTSGVLCSGNVPLASLIHGKAIRIE